MTDEKAYPVGRRWVLVLSSGFGTGYSPVASGTTGSLPGVLLAVLITGWLPLVWQAVACLLLVAVSFPICDAAEKIYGRKDDRRIVADEYLTFPLCVLGLPWQAHWWLLPMAFVVARALDIVKPPPARQFQDRLKGGAGVVMDDLTSTLYAWGINHLIWLVMRHALPVGG